MFNRTILMGRICTAPELKTTPNGVTVLSFRLAVERNYAAKGEERKSDFFTVVAWRSTAEFIARYFSKGRMILVEGELQTRQYKDKNGSDITVTELVANTVHFTGEKKEATASALIEEPAPTASSEPSIPHSASVPLVEECNDDYPF